MRALGMTPDNAARNTTAKAAVVASFGSNPKAYIRIGTESMAPPAPTKPRTAPIKEPAIRAPRISM